MIRDWTLHGTTGMAVASGHRTPTLDMVHPHLLQQRYGDQRTGECTLLKKKITQDDFALYSFSASSFIFAHSYQKEIIPFMCTEFRLFQCWYIRVYIEIKSHLSPHIFCRADRFWSEWTLYQLRILSIVRLNERLWRSEFHPFILCFGQLFSIWPEVLNLAFNL